MHPLRLDYTNRVVWWTSQGAAWLGIGLFLVAVTGSYYWYLGEETALVMEKIEAVRQQTGRERMGKEKLTEELKTFRADIKESQTVLGQLTIPWDPLFVAVEEVWGKHSDRIALMAIHPDVSEQRVVIDGRSADFDVLLDFVTQLTEFDIIDHAYLSRHQREDKDHAKPVRFSIVAEWRVRT
ncbi:MAG: hypothetical protein HXY51_08775 [Nitrospirae bacterium]|nr:hypothetical protein [Nitrospirota bacterium]